VSQFDNAIS